MEYVDYTVNEKFNQDDRRTIKGLGQTVEGVQVGWKSAIAKKIDLIWNRVMS